jgi:hypothetical protein
MKNGAVRIANSLFDANRASTTASAQASITEHDPASRRTSSSPTAPSCAAVAPNGGRGCGVRVGLVGGAHLDVVDSLFFDNEAPISTSKAASGLGDGSVSADYSLVGVTGGNLPLTRTMLAGDPRFVDAPTAISACATIRRSSTRVWRRHRRARRRPRSRWIACARSSARPIRAPTKTRPGISFSRTGSNAELAAIDFATARRGDRRAKCGGRPKAPATSLPKRDTGALRARAFKLRSCTSPTRRAGCRSSRSGRRGCRRSPRCR